MLKLAAYKGKGDFFDKLIRFWRGSKYSHVEVIVHEYENGMFLSCTSQAPNGVRALVRTMLDTEWDFFDIPETDTCNADTVYKWFVDHNGCGYDWLDILRFIIPIIPQSKSRYICSEACAESLGIPNAYKYAPDSLVSALK